MSAKPKKQVGLEGQADFGKADFGKADFSKADFGNADLGKADFGKNFLRDVLLSRVYDLARRTPLERLPNLSQRWGCDVWLKREDLQPGFSFKVRGAYNKIASLSAKERASGVMCVSAGNHAQGVAMSARHLGIAATVVMPSTTPKIKVNVVRSLGAEVMLQGDSFEEAAVFCEQLCEKKGSVFIHPFDDPLVIAGQSTVGLEVIQQLPDVQAVFVPVGGGGLIAGIGAFIKQISPKVQVFGVEPEDSNCMQQALKAGRRVKLAQVGRFADGVAVAQAGRYTFACAAKYVDGVIAVSTDEICSAIKWIYEETRSIAEPSGALGLAGVNKYMQRTESKGMKVAAIHSGANMNFDRFQFVAERTLTGEQREALFAVTLPERRQALRNFCEKVVGSHAITEFNYRLADRNQAHIFIGIGLDDAQERQQFSQALDSHGYQHTDLTDNELAKTHIRHMVGGKSTLSKNERIYSFQFPERPGALMKFLLEMHPSWNISLFHYRMHGADYGRVLMGFEIPSAEQKDFQQFLQDINYAYQEETDNLVYRLFL